MVLRLIGEYGLDYSELDVLQKRLRSRDLAKTRKVLADRSIALSDDETRILDAVG